jgi:cell division septal protein FtsQ
MRLEEYYMRKKNANIRKGILFYFALLLISVLTIWGFFWIPYFRITNIDTSEIANPSDIQKTISDYLKSSNYFFLPNNHYVFLSADHINKLLKEHGFGLASANKLFPDTLIIKLKNTEPWLIFCASNDIQANKEPEQNDCYYVYENGILGERSPRFSENPMPLIYPNNFDNLKVGNNIISTEDSAFLKKWLTNLKTIDALPTEISLLKNEEIKIVLKEGWFILITKKSNFQKIFNDLKLLLDQKIKDSRKKLEYIDLRFENKAFYKLR